MSLYAVLSVDKSCKSEQTDDILLEYLDVMLTPATFSSTNLEKRQIRDNEEKDHVLAKHIEVRQEVNEVFEARMILYKLAKSI